jgi:hypothetical protein
MARLWSLTLRSPVRGASLAREAEMLLVRDSNATLWLLNGKGDLQGNVRLAGTTAVCASDDGSTLVSAGVTGQVWRVGMDLAIMWERQLPNAGLAAAVDPLGEYIAVSDKTGGLSLLTNTGTTVARFQSPRPLHHVAFMPSTTQLIGAADFGWCGCLDLTTGDWTWTDRPVSHIGALAVTDSGNSMVLACFSDGIRRYGPGNRRGAAIALPAPCGHVAMSFAGDIGAAAGSGRDVYAFDRNGGLLFSLQLERPPATLALSALGDRLICGFADGTIKMMEFKPSA